MGSGRDRGQAQAGSAYVIQRAGDGWRCRRNGAGHPQGMWRDVRLRTTHSPASPSPSQPPKPSPAQRCVSVASKFYGRCRASTVTPRSPLPAALIKLTLRSLPCAARPCVVAPLLAGLAVVAPISGLARCQVRDQLLQPSLPFSRPSWDFFVSSALCLPLGQQFRVLRRR